MLVHMHILASVCWAEKPFLIIEAVLLEAHQLSGWKSEIDRQSFCWMAKRPLGVSMSIDGGLYGYWGENTTFLNDTCPE